MNSAAHAQPLPTVTGSRWRQWFNRFLFSHAQDVEAEYLRSLYRNYLSNSPACIFATLFLYLAAIDIPPGPGPFYWVLANVSYHCLRIVVGMLYLRRTHTSSQELRCWNCLSVLLQMIDGFLMLVLALFIYPTLDSLAQCIVLMACLIIVGATASSLAWRWGSMLVYAPPTYLGFAWATWPLDHVYAKPTSMLVLAFFVLYLFHARNHRRSVNQALDLARRNGELARGNGELAQELQIKNEQLQEVASARSRLLATVSHDLRQPSHAIGLLCERVMLEPNPVLVKDALRDLNELSQSLSASLTTLMDLTRLDAGLVRTNVVPTALSQVLLRLNAEFDAAARNKGLRLNVPHSDLWVRTDPVLLHGVLANLLSNAIKYTRCGHIDVELSVHGGELLISVRDTGLGIRPDKLDLIFKEFVRLEGAESGTEGLGLGLSIVKRYAALLGHRLQVSSQPDQGSCFSIAVPAVEMATQAITVEPASRLVASDDARLAGLRVLVVDNVDLVLSSMVRTLSAWGCQAHPACSLNEARAVSEQHRLDLIISDFHLGDEEPDGLKLITTLRSRGGHTASDLPALLMTGDVSAQLEAEALRSEVGLLHKPVRPAVLQNRLLDLLGRSQASVTAAEPERGAAGLSLPVMLQAGAA